MNKIFAKILAIHAPDTSIARGFACGAAISMTPFVGLHTLLAVITAFITRSNIPAAIIGTIVGNPWTFALIWPLTYETGRRMLHIPRHEDINFEVLFENIQKAFRTHHWSLVDTDIKEIIVPMALGSVIFYVLAFIISYVCMMHFLKRLHKNI